jgi:hypothetical protein
MSSGRRWKRVTGEGGGAIVGKLVKFTDQGQEIEGVWEGSRAGKYGLLGVLATADGPVTFPMHTVLVDRLEAVTVGDTVKIVYLGMQASKESGKSFKNFDVFSQAEGDDDDEDPF